MFNNQKVVVTMTSWTKRIANCVKVIQSILENTVKPDIVFLNLSIEEFPNRLKDLPKDLVELSLKNPIVKIGWDYDIDTLFQNEKVISIEDNECSDVKFIENQLSSIEGRQTLDMTVITCHHGGTINPLRKRAMRQAIHNWFVQSNLPKEFLFIELVVNEKNTFSQKDFSDKITYVRIEGNSKYGSIFQKECLWNIGSRMAKYDKLMFIDYDTSPLGNVDWFSKVSSELDCCLFTQGYRQISYVDSNMNPQIEKYTISHMTNNWRNVDWGDSKVDSPVPGGSYCISKDVLNKIGGWNTCFFGAGDSIFFNEFLPDWSDFKTKQMSVCLMARPGIHDIANKIAKSSGKKLIGSVDVDIIHFYHGEISNRSYSVRLYLAMMLFPQEAFFEKNQFGLLFWKCTNNILHDMFGKLEELNNSIDIVQRRFMEINIDFIAWKKKVDRLNNQYGSGKISLETVRESLITMSEKMIGGILGNV